MKSKIQKIQILKKGILLILILAILMPTIAYAYSVNDGMLLQDSTALEKLMYGEIGSIVKKIEKHFKSHTTLYITNENQLRALAAYVDNGNSCYGKKIELLNDIEVNTDIDWEPIGNVNSHFSGTFDGKGFSVNNLTYKCRNAYGTSTTDNPDRSGIGFFGVVSDRGIVKNLNIKESKITTDGTNIAYWHVGNIAGINYGTILNCSADKMPDKTSYGCKNIGLLVGLNKGTIKLNKSEDTGSTEETGITIVGLNEGGSIIYEEDSGANGESINLNGVNVKLLLENSNNIYDVGDTLTLQFEVDGRLYAGVVSQKKLYLNGNVQDVDQNVDYDESTSSEVNCLGLRFPLVTIGELVATPVAAEISEGNENGEIPKTILEYSYTVTADQQSEGNYEDIIIDFEKNFKGETIGIYAEETELDDFYTKNEIKGKAEFSDNAICLDAKIPQLELKVYAQEASKTNRYPVGKEIILELTSTEKIKDTVAPEINVLFSKSGYGKYNYQSNRTIGNAVHVDALIDEKGRTKWIYSYIIQPGDEGELDIECLSGAIKDLADKENSYKEEKFIIKDKTIYADSTSPKVQIIPDIENSATNQDEVIFKFKWSEELKEFNGSKVNVINGSVDKFIMAGDINEDGIIGEGKDTDTHDDDDYRLLKEYIEYFSKTEEEREEIKEKAKEEAEEEGKREKLDIIKYLEEQVDELICDVNADGEVDEKDLKLLEDYLNLKLSDINQDGEIDNIDLTSLKEFIDSNGAIDSLAEFCDLNRDEKVDEKDYKKLSDYIELGIEAKITTTYSKMRIITNVEEGDVYDLYVMIEQDSCHDLVGYSNVRTESIIRVDKKAPILNHIEAYAETENINGEIKERFKTGDKIKIVAVFDESIDAITEKTTNEDGEEIDVEKFPTLKLQFSESGDIKGKLEPAIEGNKLVYTYIIKDGDYGTLSINGFSGTIKDLAGNTTRVNKRTLEGNTIVADTFGPKIKEIKVVEPKEPGEYKEGEKVTIEVIYDEEVKILETTQESEPKITQLKKEIEIENEDGTTETIDNAPILKLEFNLREIKNFETGIIEGTESGIREAEFSSYGKKEDGSDDRTKLIYTYTIQGEEVKEVEEDGEKVEKIYSGDNGPLQINSITNSNKCGNSYQICDDIGNLYLSEENEPLPENANGIIADTKMPKLVSVDTKIIKKPIVNCNKYYKAGSEVKVTLKFNEEVSPVDAEKLQSILIGFGYYKESVSYDYIEQGNWEVNKEKTEYSFVYTIEKGDNGYLWINIPHSQFKDCAGNENIEQEYGVCAGDDMVADTYGPTITLPDDIISDNNGQTYTVEAKFSEYLYKLNGDTIGELTEYDAPKLVYCFGEGENKEAIADSVNGRYITYIFEKDSVNDNGDLKCLFVKGNFCDQAGNEYNESTTSSTDSTAPILKSVVISSDAGEGLEYCKEGTTIYVTATFDEEIANSNMILKVKIGESEEFELSKSTYVEEGETLDPKQIRYVYTVEDGDEGEFTIVDVCGSINDKITEENADKTYGYVVDEHGNQNNIYSFEDEDVSVQGNATLSTLKPYITRVEAKVSNKVIASYEKEDGKEAVKKRGSTNSNKIIYVVTFNKSIKEIDSSKILIENGIIVTEDIKLVEGTENQLEIEVQPTLTGVQSLKFTQGTVKDLAGYNNSTERFDIVSTDFEGPTVRFISEYNGGVYVLPTNIGKVELRPNIQINEDIDSVEYKWVDCNSQTGTDSQYKKIENYSSSSDITVPGKSFTTEGTYELCIKVSDIAGNVTEARKRYEIIKSSIGIEFDNEYTNEDLTVTVEFGEGLTDNRKVTFKAVGTEQVVEINAIGTDEEGNVQYKIPTNGTIYVEATDRIGNKVFTEEKIENIDKEAPVINIGVNGANLVIGTGEEKAKIIARVNVTDNEEVLANNFAFYKENINIEELDEEEREILIGNIKINAEDDMTLADSTKGVPYYLYVFAIDKAGNEVLEKSGPYHIYDTNERKIIVEKENVGNNSNTVLPDNTIGNVIVPEVETEEKIVPPEIIVKGKLISFKQEGKIYNITYNNFGEDEENLNIIREAKITLTDAKDGYIDPENNYVEVYKPTTITVEGKDACGNKVIVTEEVTREKIEGPEFEVYGNPENWTNQNVKLEVYCNNELSALTVNGTNILSTDEKVVSHKEIEENGEYKFVATDIYGNTSEKTVKVTKIDKDKPTISKVESSNKTIIITATDVINEKEGSGIAKYAITDTTETPIKWSESKEIKVTHDGIWYAWVMDNAGNIRKSVESIIVDTTAPTIRFDYALLTVEPGIPIETNITTDEDAIISYSWDNKEWKTSEKLITTIKVTKTYGMTGRYTLYAKAVDKFGNESKAQIEFNVSKPEEVLDPQIVFEGLKVTQVDGVKYVKVTSEMKTTDITNKMNKEALCGQTPEYTKLAEGNKVKTGSEITLNDDTKYIVVVNGDVNSDGQIDFVKDIIRANNYRLGIIKLSVPQMLAADINNNGKIEFIQDIISINNHRLGLIESL